MKYKRQVAPLPQRKIKPGKKLEAEHFKQGTVVRIKPWEDIVEFGEVIGEGERLGVDVGGDLMLYKHDAETRYVVSGYYRGWVKLYDRGGSETFLPAQLVEQVERNRNDPHLIFDKDGLFIFVNTRGIEVDGGAVLSKKEALQVFKQMADWLGYDLE